MAVREIIVSGYLTAESENKDIDPFLRHLLGQFVDELSESDKLLYEYCGMVGLPDLWIAMWDDVKLELWMLPSDGPEGQTPRIILPHPPKQGPKVMLPALYELMRIAENHC